MEILKEWCCWTEHAWWGSASSLGLTGSLALSGALAGELYGVSPRDPMVLGAVARSASRSGPPLELRPGLARHPCGPDSDDAGRVAGQSRERAPPAASCHRQRRPLGLGKGRSGTASGGPMDKRLAREPRREAYF